MAERLPPIGRPNGLSDLGRVRWGCISPNRERRDEFPALDVRLTQQNAAASKRPARGCRYC
jgi:hypothetical protein